MIAKKILEKKAKHPIIGLCEPILTATAVAPQAHIMTTK